MRAQLLALCLMLLAFGCRQRQLGAQEETKGVTAANATSAAAIGAQLARILAAEQAQAPASIEPGALSSRNVEIRRAAARALARVATPETLPGMSQLLGDEDPQVVAWSAFGLGRRCNDDAPATLGRLVARAVSLQLEPSSAEPKKGAHEPTAPSPAMAVTGALARCRSQLAEHTLRAWLGGNRPWNEASALALGRLAKSRGRLDDSSIVELLNHAGADSAAAAQMLYPLGELEGLSPASSRRLLQLAPERLRAGGLSRHYAIEALATAGPDAVPLLGSLLASPDNALLERLTALRSLGQLGKPGQKALLAALGQIEPAALAGAPVDDPRWSLVLGILQHLSWPLPAEHDIVVAFSLFRLAGDRNPSPALERRAVLVRCEAAQLVAGRASLHNALNRCDPEAARPAALATVRVLDRGKIRGARKTRWEEFAQSQDPAVRQAALRLLATHPEIAGAHRWLSAALADKHPGTVTTAAQLLATQPALATPRAPTQPNGRARAESPHRDVVRALEGALRRKFPPDQIAASLSLIDAARALQILSLKGRIEQLCGQRNTALRQRAQAALRAMGDKQRQCTANPSLEDATVPPKTAPVLLFYTDSGKHWIRLRPDLAPLATRRLLALVEAGFYNGMRIHRVQTGKIIQIGDKQGDGYGGADMEPIVSEDSPLPFEAFRVGLAHAGPDTASSQFFITLVPAPQLDGRYPLVGSASESWQTVVLGDVIREVHVAARDD